MMCENKGQDEKDKDVMLRPLILVRIFVILQRIRNKKNKKRHCNVQEKKT